MKFKLAIGNKVTFDVIGKVTETATSAKPFKFRLTCDRLDQETMEKHMQDKGESIKDFMVGITHDWADQRLVLNEDDSPAAFGPEAFDALLSIAGMPMYLYASYIKAVAVKEKN